MNGCVYRPPPDAPAIIHADSDIVVASKPAGLLSVPGRGPAKADCLEARLASAFPGIRAAHRLDMETSGLIILARSDACLKQLNRAFAARHVHKTYRALTRKAPSPVQGEIALPLSADWPNRPRQKVDPANGKPSLTHYRVLGPSGPGIALELEPVTGRTHQLRVHLAAIGHPILGDTLYGEADDLHDGERLMLHACRLAVRHPVSGERLNFRDPAPF